MRRFLHFLSTALSKEDMKNRYRQIILNWNNFPAYIIEAVLVSFFIK